MELKAALKEAKKLLSENKNEQALNLLQVSQSLLLFLIIIHYDINLQEFLDDGVEDYMLLCFAALACGNLDNPSRARTLYEKVPVGYDLSCNFIKSQFLGYNSRRKDADRVAGTIQIV